MKKTFDVKHLMGVISATTALWAVVGFSAIHFEWLFLLTRSVTELSGMFNGMQEQLQELMQAYWSCIHAA